MSILWRKRYLINSCGIAALLGDRRPVHRVCSQRLTGEATRTGWQAACQADPALAKGLSTHDGALLSEQVAADATFPANIEGTWGCQHKTTPKPGGAGPAATLDKYYFQETGRHEL